MRLRWWSACLVCTEPWVQSPAPPKRNVVVHSCNPHTWRLCGLQETLKTKQNKPNTKPVAARFRR